MPVGVRFGSGCSASIPDELGDSPALVMAFAPATALGWRARWESALGDRLRGWIEVPDGLSSLACCRALAPPAWQALADSPGCVLVALGGGTTLDVAKLLRCRPRHGGFDAVANALRGHAPWPALDLAPLWMVPTTAGTGSEVTRWATLWDTDVRPALKRSFDEPFGYACRAFVDPALTLSCPPAVTRDTALDALSHALEAIWNRHANPVSDALALSAARQVIRTLPTCLRDPRELRWREALALASLQAGMAFSQTRTALAHALSYDVTLRHRLPHGLAVALWLPTAWSLAAGREPRVDALLGAVFGEGGAGGEDGLAALRRWLTALGVPADPAAIGIHDGADRVQAALRSPRGRNFVGAPHD